MYRAEIEEWMKEAEREEKRLYTEDMDEEHDILSTDHVILGAGDRRPNNIVR